MPSFPSRGNLWLPQINVKGRVRPRPAAEVEGRGRADWRACGYLGR